MRYANTAEEMTDLIKESDARSGRMDLPTKTLAQLGPVRWDGMAEAYVTRQGHGDDGIPYTEEAVIKARVLSHRKQQVTLTTQLRETLAQLDAPPIYLRQNEVLYVTQTNGRVIRMRVHKVQGQQATLVPVPDKD